MKQIPVRAEHGHRCRHFFLTSRKNMHQTLKIQYTSLSSSSAWELPPHRGARCQEGQCWEHQRLEGEVAPMACCRKQDPRCLQCFSQSQSSCRGQLRVWASSATGATRGSISSARVFFLQHATMPSHLVASDAPLVVLPNDEHFYVKASPTLMTATHIGVQGDLVYTFSPHSNATSAKNAHVASMDMWCTI